MLATADILKEGLYETKEELNMFIETIHEQGLHLIELINAILDFSKIQAGKMDYYVEHLNIHSLIEEELASAQSTAEISNISLNLKPDNREQMCFFDAFYVILQKIS